MNENDVRQPLDHAELLRKWKRSERMWTVLGWLALSAGGLLAAWVGFTDWWGLLVGALLGFGGGAMKTAGGAEGRYERIALVSTLLAELDDPR